MAPVLIAAGAYLLNWITVGQLILATAAYAYSTSRASSARKRARADYNASLRDRVNNTAVVDGERSRVYGRVRVADGIVFKGSHGENSRFYTLVVALAGHEIDGVEQVYFNDQLVTLDGAGYVLTAPWSASASGVGGTPRHALITLSGGEGFVDLGLVPMLGSVYIGDSEGLSQVPAECISLAGNRVTVSGAGPDFNGTFGLHYTSLDGGGTAASKARVRAFLGGPAQDLSGVLAPLFPGLITSQHRFAGMACLVVTLEYDQDAYPTGVPQISAVVRGAKVLDPRTGITAWTENPALIARDWALYAHGGGAEAGDLKAASFIAAANACDVPASFTTVNAAGSSSTATLPTYTCGIVIPTDTAPDAALDDIVASMAGEWAWAGGQLVLRAGSYQAPSLTIDETWVSDAGAIDIVPQRARTELVNIVTPSIANKAQAFVAAPIPRIEAPEYIAEDGGEYPLDIELRGVTDVAHAAHVAGVMLRAGRQALTVQLPCNLKALQVELFDTVLLSLERFGWVAKPFEVVGWRFGQAEAVMLTLRETDASIYTVGAAFSRSDAAPNTALPSPFGVPALAGLAATSGNAELLQQADGTIVSRVRVSWPAVEDRAVQEGGAIEIQWAPWGSSADLWQSARAEGSSTQAFISGVQDGGVLLIRARARNKLVAGPWRSLVHQVQGKTAAPGDVLDLTAEPVPGGIALSWTACPDLDYAETELRLVPPELAAGIWTWDEALPLWMGTGDGWFWPATETGEQTLVARHRDTSGNLSAGLSVLVVEVVPGSVSTTPRLDLSSYALTLPASSTGVVDSYAEATVTARVLSGTADVTGAWTLARINGFGVSSSLAGGVLSISDLSVDGGSVEVTASAAGYTTLRAKLSLSKARAGAAGTPGAPGAPGAPGSPGSPGAPGSAGQRGSVETSRAISGSSWSNAEALAAISAAGYGSPIALDRVTLFNSGTGYTETRFYNGVSWLPFETLINGNLLVSGTVGADKMVTNLLSSNNVLTRGLTVRDALGNVILGAGAPLPVAYAAPGTLNSSLVLAADGRLWNGGTAQGQMTTLPTLDTRSTNASPDSYSVGVTEEFKGRAVVGAPGSETYGILRTEKAWNDPTGGVVTQTFKSADGEWKRTSTPGSFASWGAWTPRLDRQITYANISTYIAGAAIDLARINVASIGMLSALSASMGTVTIDSFGWLRGGQTNYATGTGFFLGWSGGAYKFSIGDSGTYMRWTGSALEVKLTPIVASGMGGVGWIGGLGNASSPTNVAVPYVSAPSNGVAPYTYNWTLVGKPPVMPVSITAFDNSCVIYAQGINTNFDISVSCSIVDANGRVTVVPGTVSGFFGTPP